MFDEEIDYEPTSVYANFESEDEMALADFGESKVTVKKDVLLAAMYKNRSAHYEEFLKAQAGYREEVIRVLDETLEKARKGNPFNVQVPTTLVVPQEHTRDYDRVIRMLEMAIADEVTVTEQQFSQYVLDDWGWRAAFIASTSRYSGGR